jgi:hypothetical protein
MRSGLSVSWRARSYALQHPVQTQPPPVQDWSQVAEPPQMRPQADRHSWVHEREPLQRLLHEPISHDTWQSAPWLHTVSQPPLQPRRQVELGAQVISHAPRAQSKSQRAPAAQRKAQAPVPQATVHVEPGPHPMSQPPVGQSRWHR